MLSLLLLTTPLFVIIVDTLPLQSDVGTALNGHRPTILKAEIKRMLSEGVSKASTRRKRSTVGTEDESVEPLGDLSDKELALLARIVKNELNRYKVSDSSEDYEVDELPYASDSNAGMKVDNDMNEFYDNVIVIPNDVRRSVLQSVIEAPEDVYDDEQHVPEIVLMPGEEMDDETELNDIKSGSLDDLELRARIALLAEALNERATRRF